MTRPSKLTDLDGLVAHIVDGCLLAIPSDSSGVSMAATRALIRRGVRNLHLVVVPTGGLPADLLIGAGCVATLEGAAVSLGEQGLAPRFREAVERGAIDMRDATCPAVHAGLIAAEKGVPFLPVRGILGSDVLCHRPDWRVVDNPFAESGDPLVLVPAIRPDVALFHAPMADTSGNIWIGIRRELMTMAHAARITLATVETIVDCDLLSDEKMAPGTIAHVYVTGCAKAERGASPLGLAGYYSADSAHLADYAEQARTADGFGRYLADHGMRRAAA
ncbi:MAG: CoA transferase subunit A [Pseudorhodoplanes sp.]|uniref:CoA transferase subunit A n=1 Tax=Pseudorhodoplanes sp. TaxID=1934341 RepID=UPI003D0D6BEA